MRRHAPSVQTSTSPDPASGRWPGSDLDRRRGLTAIGGSQPRGAAVVRASAVCAQRCLAWVGHARAEALRRPLNELLVAGGLSDRRQCQRRENDRQPDARAAPEELLHQDRERQTGRVDRGLKILQGAANRGQLAQKAGTPVSYTSSGWTTWACRRAARRASGRCELIRGARRLCLNPDERIRRVA